MASRLQQFHKFGKKIIGIGMNYKNIPKAFGAPVPNKPLFFLKPTTSYITEDSEIRTPPSCKEFLFEIEFGVVIGKTGYKIPKSAVDKHVGGYCIALDMTSKDHWVDANKNGHPWTMSKCFDASTAIGNFIDKSRIPDPENVQMWLNLNGTQRQSENTGNMIFPVDFLIEHISKDMTLEEGDLIITGTPLGFDTVQKGDIIEAGFQGIDSVKFFVAKD